MRSNMVVLIIILMVFTPTLASCRTSPSIEETQAITHPAKPNELENSTNELHQLKLSVRPSRLFPIVLRYISKMSLFQTTLGAG